MSDNGARKNGGFTWRDIAMAAAGLIAFGALQAQTSFNSHRIERIEHEGSPNLAELRQRVAGVEKQLASVDQAVINARLIPGDSITPLFARVAVIEKDLRDLESTLAQQQKARPP